MSTTEMVQKSAASILKQLVDVFEKNNLRYVVFFGSLLGTVRHKGFIPWDDDVDITMPREDFLKFRAIAKDILPENLFFQDYTTDSEYPSTIAKIRDCNTTMVENGYRKLRNMNHGIFVDIFVADYYLPTKLNKMRIKMLKIQKSILLSQKVCVCGKAKQTLARLIPRNYTFKRIEKMLSSMDKKQEHKYFFVDCCPIPLEPTMFDDALLVPFEDFNVRIPKNYDAILTGIYKNYMELPPVERRRPIHTTNHVSCDIPFKKYLDEHPEL